MSRYLKEFPTNKPTAPLWAILRTLRFAGMLTTGDQGALWMMVRGKSHPFKVKSIGKDSFHFHFAETDLQKVSRNILEMRIQESYNIFSSI